MRVHRPVRSVVIPSRGVLLVAAAAVLWGTSGLAASVAYQRGVEPLTVSFWRMALGALAALPLMRPAGESLPRLTWPAGFRLSVAGIGLAGYQAGFFLAVQHAGVSVATLLTLGLAPVVVIAVERMIGRRRTSRRRLVGVLIAVVGLAALVGAPSPARAGVITGAAFAAGSAVGYATLTLNGHALGAAVGVRRVTPLTFIVAAAALLPVASVATGILLPRDPMVVGLLLYLGTVPTALAYACFFAGLRTTPAAVAAVLALFEPLTATALAVPLLDERLTAFGWLGAATLLTAIVVVSAGAGDSSVDSVRP